MGNYSPEFIPPGEYAEEVAIHSPEIHLSYNAAGDLIEIRKFTAAGAIYKRAVRDPDITDYEISRTVIYSRWNKMSR